MKMTDILHMIQGYKWYLGAYKLHYGSTIELHFVPCEVMQPVIDSCYSRN
jgi:hypothetical protein